LSSATKSHQKARAPANQYLSNLKNLCAYNVTTVRDRKRQATAEFTDALQTSHIPNLTVKSKIDRSHSLRLFVAPQVDGERKRFLRSSSTGEMLVLYTEILLSLAVI
jgi:hypothetical protein